MPRICGQSYRKQNVNIAVINLISLIFFFLPGHFFSPNKEHWRDSTASPHQAMKEKNMSHVKTTGSPMIIPAHKYFLFLELTY